MEWNILPINEDLVKEGKEEKEWENWMKIKVSGDQSKKIKVEIYGVYDFERIWFSHTTIDNV